jgi:hypothetical protein
MIDRMHILQRADSGVREAVDLWEAYRVEELRPGVVVVHFKQGFQGIYAVSFDELMKAYLDDMDVRTLPVPEPYVDPDISPEG